MQDHDRRSSRRERRAIEREAQKKNRITGGAALALGALAAGGTAEAATFTVTNLTDAGAGSLRQAVTDANGAAGADMVVFQAGLTGTITLTSGDIDITDSVDIQGPGAASLTVSGNNASRIFYLYNPAGGLVVSISGLTLTQGSAGFGGAIVDFDADLTLDSMVITANDGTTLGGGIAASGLNMDLVIRNSTFSGNSSLAQEGGAMYIDEAASVLIENCQITGNDSIQEGGGIYFYDPDGPITIRDSTISGNSATLEGGGIYVYDTDAPGNMLITSSTISGNQAGSVGGGAYFYGNDTPTTIESSTISGNSALFGGGAFFLYLYGGQAVRHSTVAGNTATNQGGGLFTYFGTQVELDHAIVADNTSALDPDLAALTPYPTAFSLIETPGAVVTDNGGNLFSVDPQLAVLGNNGGPTETHLPAGTSPAVDAGDAAFVPPPATDQRGLPRVASGRIDMGSVELVPLAPGTIQFQIALSSVGEAAGMATVTLTRTGGADGAVDVTIATTDGSAIAPGDYGNTGGTVAWADQDAADKTFNISIVNDAVVEPDEDFLVILSNPTGGAALGPTTTHVVTITNDDVPNVLEIPTLGDWGKILLAALLGMGGLTLVRRRKNAIAPLALAVGLAAGAGTAEAAMRGTVDQRATTITQVEVRGADLFLRLADGTEILVPRAIVNIRDFRPGHRGQIPELTALPANQPVMIRVKRDPAGAIKRVRVEVQPSTAAAQEAAAGNPEN